MLIQLRLGQDGVDWGDGAQHRWVAVQRELLVSDRELCTQSGHRGGRRTA